MKPEFIDNQAENTMARAIREYLADWPTGWGSSRAASGHRYFNPGGFGHLADALESLQETKLLLGAEPLPAPTLAIAKAR